MARPGPRKIPITVKFHPDELIRIERLADELAVNRSELIRRATEHLTGCQLRSRTADSSGSGQYPILRHFNHLPEHLHDICRSFYDLAHQVADELPHNKETKTSLLELAYARDAAILAVKFPSDYCGKFPREARESRE